MQKHLPLRLKETDEGARIRDVILKEVNASLRESFDL